MSSKGELFKGELLEKFNLVFSKSCAQLCKKYNLSQRAFQILLLLGLDHRHVPNCKTESDIIKFQAIDDAKLVSVNVEQLVKDGYLTKQAAEDGSDETYLLCTEKARPILEETLNTTLYCRERALEGIDDEALNTFKSVLKQITQNVNQILEDKNIKEKETRKK